MKPLTNQRRQTPAASSAQSLHRASFPHAEFGEKNCNRFVIIFSDARNYLMTVQFKAERNQPLDLKWRQPLECGDLSPLFV
jgi:hypothetical protein